MPPHKAPQSPCANHGCSSASRAVILLAGSNFVILQTRSRKCAFKKYQFSNGFRDQSGRWGNARNRQTPAESSNSRMIQHHLMRPLSSADMLPLYHSFRTAPVVELPKERRVKVEGWRPFRARFLTCKCLNIKHYVPYNPHSLLLKLLGRISRKSKHRL